MLQIPAHHTFYEAHKVAICLGSYIVTSAAIGSLPAPTAKSSQFYLWFFKFANTIGANIARALNTKVEGSPNFIDAVKKLNGSQQ